VCVDCLNGYTASEAGQDSRHIELRGGKIFCPLKTFRERNPGGGIGHENREALREEVRKTPLFIQYDHFAKTGSGQT
jgi:hypothetical protein